MNFTLKDLDKIYFCTGARNHDLLEFFPTEKIIFEYDERMASFKALGRTKTELKAVAICTTSGTAVSECLSAMLEAKYSGLPLVLISGDRPRKQHGTGSPQTLDHELITKAGRGSYYEVEIKDLAQLEISHPVYPVHINVLVDDTTPHKRMIVRHSSLASFATFFELHKKPLFLFSHEEKSMRPFVKRIAELQLPFYAEAMSGAHDLSPLKSEKNLLKLFRSGEFDSVVRVGHTPLSKVWRLLESTMMPVVSFDSRSLPGLSYGELYPLCSSELLNDDSWWELLKKVKFTLAPDDSETLLQNLLQQFPEAEVSYFMKLQELLPKDSLVYLGNSLIIRHFELTQRKPFRVHGNRGVNGIDGQLATAIGMASSVEENVYCILGDITTLYDLSSLREMPENLKLIIMNNFGGRIFEGLKLDKRIILEHNFSFASLCKGMDLSYACNDWSQFGKSQVLELNPSREQGHKFLKEWLS